MDTPTNWPWDIFTSGIAQQPRSQSVLPQGAGLVRPAALTGPGAVHKRSPVGSNLARALNRVAFESGQAPKLVRHPDGGYGYKVESRAPQRHPLIQALQEIAGSAQPPSQAPSPWEGAEPIQPMPTTQPITSGPLAGTTFDPATGKFYDSEGRVVAIARTEQRATQPAGATPTAQPQGGGVFGPVQPTPATPLPRSNGRIAPPADQRTAREWWDLFQQSGMKSLRDFIRSVGGRITIRKSALLGDIVKAIMPDGTVIPMSFGHY